MNLTATVRPGTPPKRQDPPRNSDRSQMGRADGWTPSRIRTFLDTLAERGVVADTARAGAGSTPRGALRCCLRAGASRTRSCRARSMAVPK